jgi:hypothetical protein
MRRRFESAPRRAVGYATVVNESPTHAFRHRPSGGGPLGCEPCLQHSNWMPIGGAMRFLAWLRKSVKGPPGFEPGTKEL